MTVTTNPASLQIAPNGSIVESTYLGTSVTPPVTMSTLVTFNGGASSLPQTTPVIDAAGNLYGQTTGQPGSTGTIFEIAKTGGLYASTPGPINTGIAVVDPNDALARGGTTMGVVPQSALLMDAAGSVIFSNTVRAGLFPFGAVPDGSVQLVGVNAAPFLLASKSSPWAPQIALITGNDMFVVDGLTGSLDVFFGVNASPFGTSGVTVDHAIPLTGVTGSMAVDTAGNVFCTANNQIFELLINDAAQTVSTPLPVATFTGANGTNPQGLIADGAGNLFGTTSSGGAFDQGTVFELVNSGASYSLVTLTSFNGANGTDPNGSLLEDGAGNLFGTTQAGGADNDGTVFEIAKTGGVYASTPTTLISFNGVNGAAPESGLTFDASGNLFGTTSTGGANNAGTVFELSNTGFNPSVAPWVATEQATVTAGSSVSGTAGASGTGALAGDIDYNGLVHSISAIAGGTLGAPVHGTYGDLTLNADGSFNYVAGATAAEINNIMAASGQVTDAFAYSVTDGHGHTGAATLDIGLNATAFAAASGPTVTGAVATPSSGEFNTGKIIPIFLEMNEPITVTGTTATLTLSNGGQATLDAASTASLQRFGLIAFDYKVASTDQDAAGLTISSLNLNGTTVTDSLGFPANFSGTLPSLPNIGVVTVAPTLSTMTVDSVPLVGPSPQVFVTPTTSLQTPVTFSASATDPIDGTDPVTFTENGHVVHSGDNFSLGSHTIYASATNSAGVTTSESFIVDLVAQQMSIGVTTAIGTTGPGGAHVTLSANVTGGVGTDQVVFMEGQKVVQSGDLFAVGNHTLVATATDQAGDSVTDTFSFAVSDTSPPVPTSADMITTQAATGNYEIYDIGNNAVLAAYPLMQAGSPWQAVAVGGFNGSDTSDLLLRNTSTGAFEIVDVTNNNASAPILLNNVGLEWQVAGFGDFSDHPGETDMLMRDSQNGAFELYDFSNNTVAFAGPLSEINPNATVLGFGDFSGKANETDMLTRDSTGSVVLYDISNNAVTSSTTLGNLGFEWQFAAAGDFSGRPGETDLLMRDVNNGNFELYDFRNGEVTTAIVLGNVGLEWQVVGVADFSGNPNETDLLMRDSQNGNFELYDFSNNAVTSAIALGNVGLDWQVVGTAPFQLTGSAAPVASVQSPAASVAASDPVGTGGWLTQAMQTAPSGIDSWLTQAMQASGAGPPSLAGTSSASGSGFDAGSSLIAGTVPVTSLAIPNPLQTHTG